MVIILIVYSFGKIQFPRSTDNEKNTPLFNSTICFVTTLHKSFYYNFIPQHLIFGQGPTFVLMVWILIKSVHTFFWHHWENYFLNSQINLSSLRKTVINNH
ncbi:hypothetical protein DHB64_15380 [Antarcticibacterium sp. W02-3]|nr:hypothetical protein [Antarcticibacterium sp. W02-3]